MESVNRRCILRAGLVPLACAVWQRRAFAAKEFWNDVSPENWTAAEVQELLTRSPWAKPAEIKDNGEVGLTSSRPGRSGSRNEPAGAASSGPRIEWKAIVRWDSALPLRHALRDFAPKDSEDSYVLNVIGNLPNAIPPADEPEGRDGLGYLKEVTKLQHKGDEIHLSRVETAHASERSPAGTRFYFSRKLALMPEDREATFVTRIDRIEVRCRFALRDMLVRGNLEL